MDNPRNIMVTGGAGGIGRAIAKAFIEQGDRVIIADRDGEAASSVAEEVGATALTLDIADAALAPLVLDDAARACGGLDVLVNNAGLLSVHGSLIELGVADYEAILRVNVLGTYLVTQTVARQMIAKGRGGSIVNISSIGARQPTPGMGGYESSKAAVDALTRWAAIELAAHGIRVNAVAPGPVLTPMLSADMPEGSAARAAWESRIPLKALAATSDVAGATLFLASEQARHITGISLPVDGGQLLG